MELADEEDAAGKPARQPVTVDVDQHCGSYDDGVVATVTELGGAREVDADVDEQHVEVPFDPHRMDGDELRASTDDAGYTLEPPAATTGN